MDKELMHLLFALLRFEIDKIAISELDKKRITSGVVSNLYVISKKHDVAHLIADALERNGILTNSLPIKKRFLQERSMAIYRYEQQQYEVDRIQDTFEKAKIPFLLLKGSVMRQYYPEPWMRTSCDIDILVKPEDLECATNVLQEKLYFVKAEETLHDVSLYAESGVHIELHYALLPGTQRKKVLNISNRIWNILLPSENNKYEKHMPDELFYFYHIAHMVKHFEAGGCGIRPLLDNWILFKEDFWNERTESLCKEGGVFKFAQRANELSKIWFEEQSHNQVTQMMQDFILSGGMYGGLENSVTLKEVQCGGKKRYIFSRIFLPYEILKLQYPKLEKCKWLTPIYQIRRWFRIFLGGGASKAVQEIRRSHERPAVKEDMEIMLKELDLI